MKSFITFISVLTLVLILVACEKENNHPDFSERSIDDYEFSCICSNGRKDFTWEITDEDILNSLWNIICLGINEEEYDGGSASMNTSQNLILTDKMTGEEIHVGFGIWYSTPLIQGGPEAMIFEGEGWRKVCQEPDTESSNNFTNLCESGIRFSVRYTSDDITQSQFDQIQNCAFDAINKNYLAPRGYGRDGFFSIDFLVIDDNDIEKIKFLLSDFINKDEVLSKKDINIQFYVQQKNEMVLCD